MKPSLRAPVLGSVTSWKLNHWLFDCKKKPHTYVGLCGGGGLEAGPGQCYVSWKCSLKPSSTRSCRSFGGRSSPSERRHLSHPARPPRVPAAFESWEMSGAKKLCTVSRCGGKGRGCGETGLRFNLSSQSPKVCVRGVFQLARFKLRSFMWNKWLKTRDPNCTLISSNSVKCGHKVFFLVHKFYFLLPGETSKSTP